MYRLGIDLGGTNIVAGVVDEKYKIIARASCKTNVPRPESEICDSMAEVALKAVEKAKITMDEVTSIGIGVPGAVNPKTGVIEYSANLFFHNWEVVKMMQERLDKKVVIENDANAAALGEYLAGSARAPRTRLPSPSAPASAAVLSSTAKSTAAPTMPALSSVIWLSSRTARSAPAAERAAGRPTRPQPV